MKPSLSFQEFYEAYFNNAADQTNTQRHLNEFIADFIYFTPIQLELLKLYLDSGHIDLFYKSLADLKYLIEFSDQFNRYWHFLRSNSGALSKLKSMQSVKGSRKIHAHYVGRFGDRRKLRNEHWFEKKRWEFLDELHVVCTELELGNFILKYQLILAEDFEIYNSFMMVFVNDLKDLQPESVESQII